MRSSRVDALTEGTEFNIESAERRAGRNTEYAKGGYTESTKEMDFEG
jgi:hypothetical protein